MATATSKEVPPYVSSILNASFDAGVLVDASSCSKKGRGRILSANAQARELLEANTKKHLVGGSMDEFLSFWKHGEDGTVDAVHWDEVLNCANVREWPVCGSGFSGTVRLAKLDHDDFWLAFVRRSSDTSTPSKRQTQLLEGRAQEIVEAALDPMFQINEKGCILMVNKAALTCFQYQRSELLGHNISMICGQDHGKRHDSYLQTFLKTGETRVIGKYRELPARRKDGSEFAIQLAVVELETSPPEERLFCGFVHDLTTRRRNEDIIFGTIDTSLDPVFHINEKGIIKNVNRAALEHLGWTWDELLGRNVSMVVGGGHAQHHDAYIQRYLETGEARAIGKRRHVWARRQDGSELPIELQLSEIQLHGGKERLFCAILTLLQEGDKDYGSKK